MGICEGSEVEYKDIMPEELQKLRRVIAQYITPKVGEPAAALPEGFPLYAQIDPLSLMARDIMFGMGGYQQQPVSPYGTYQWSDYIRPQPTPVGPVGPDVQVGPTAIVSPTVTLTPTGPEAISDVKPTVVPYPPTPVKPEPSPDVLPIPAPGPTPQVLPSVMPSPPSPTVTVQVIPGPGPPGPVTPEPTVFIRVKPEPKPEPTAEVEPIPYVIPGPGPEPGPVGPVGPAGPTPEVRPGPVAYPAGPGYTPQPSVLAEPTPEPRTRVEPRPDVIPLEPIVSPNAEVVLVGPSVIGPVGSDVTALTVVPGSIIRPQPGAIDMGMMGIRPIYR